MGRPRWDVQVCDFCGARLKLREVKEGPHEGTEFFACPNNTVDKPNPPKGADLQTVMALMEDYQRKLRDRCPMAASFRGPDWKDGAARKQRSLLPELAVA